MHAPLHLHDYPPNCVQQGLLQTLTSKERLKNKLLSILNGDAWGDIWNSFPLVQDLHSHHCLLHFDCHHLHFDVWNSAKITTVKKANNTAEL